MYLFFGGGGGKKRMLQPIQTLLSPIDDNTFWHIFLIILKMSSREI